MYSKYKPYFISLLITLAFELLNGTATYFSMLNCADINKPAFMPSSVIFIIVWIFLTLLMSFSAANIFKSDDTRSSYAVFIYAIQLTTIFWWHIFFFGLRFYLFSFILLTVLFLLAIMMAILFYRINRITGLIQIFILHGLSFRCI